MDVKNTINECLSLGQDMLEQREYNNPRLEARLLLEHVLDCDRLYIMLNGNQLVDCASFVRYEELLEKRKTGRPIQYILGHQEFMGLDFSLNDHVLVPRADTEILVEYVIEYLKKLKKNGLERFRLLDIGTGSGAIAISIAYYAKGMGLTPDVWTVDINDKAIDISQENSKKLGVSDCVHVVKSDVFEGLLQLKEGLADDRGKVFDIIVSNPPYIASDVIKGLQTEVRCFEPQNALDGGKDGLDFYRRITMESVEWMKDEGLLAYEIGHDQGRSVSLLLEEAYEDIKVIKDYGDRDRVVVGTLRLTK